jgi:hypothetical protein
MSRAMEACSSRLRRDAALSMVRNAQHVSPPTTPCASGCVGSNCPRARAAAAGPGSASSCANYSMAASSCSTTITSSPLSPAPASTSSCGPAARLGPGPTAPEPLQAPRPPGAAMGVAAERGRFRVPRVPRPSPAVRRCRRVLLTLAAGLFPPQPRTASHLADPDIFTEQLGPTFSLDSDSRSNIPLPLRGRGKGEGRPPRVAARYSMTYAAARRHWSAAFGP